MSTAKTKNLAKAGIIGLSAFLLYKVFAKGTAVSKLNISISKINFAYAPSGLILTFMLNVSNTVAETILLNSLEGEIFFNGELLGTVNNDLQITIPASGSKIIPLSVNLFFLPSVNVITDLISGKLKGNANFEFKGIARVENFDFPVTLKYSLA